MLIIDTIINTKTDEDLIVFLAPVNTRYEYSGYDSEEETWWMDLLNYWPGTTSTYAKTCDADN